MPNPETPRESALEEAKRIIAAARRDTADQFRSSANNWINSFAQPVRALDISLYRAIRQTRELTEAEGVRLKEHLNSLKERIGELQEEYPGEDDIPPTEIQEELFQELDSFFTPPS